MTSTRLTSVHDAEELFALRAANQAFLAPWEPAAPPQGFTLKTQREALRKLLDDHEDGVVVPHVILDGDRIIGRITVSNIVRGPLQSGSLGYWVAEADNGRGHATAAVSAICALAFSELDLHRVEAGTLVHNTGSQQVLLRNGFVRFGVAPAYLQIAGRWQDHVMFQRLASPAPD